MNSVKYNNWRETVQHYRDETSGFNKETAWLKLSNQPLPARKRKRVLVWLAAACLCGMVFSWFMINRSGNKQVAVNNNTVRPVNNSKTGKAGTLTTNSSTSTAVHDERPMPGKYPVASPVQTVKEVQPERVQNTLPATVREYPEEDKPLPVTAEYAPPLAATVQPKEEIKPTAKPALKIIHLNELGQQQPVMAQQTPPEERTAPKFPLSKPGYAKYNSDEEPQPVIKQKRGFGLPRSLASLKD